MYIFTNQQKILNQYSNFDQKINQLNDYVVEECVKKIVPEIKQYCHYINDITQSRKLMALPQSVNDSKNNTLLHPYLS